MQENKQGGRFPGFWAWWYGLPLSIVQNPQGNEALSMLRKAIIGRKEETVRTLLGIGVSVNAGGEDQYTPLHSVAINGHEGIARLLMEGGADVRAVNDCHETPLHEAAKWGREGVARVLMEGGADVRAVNDRHETPLHIASLRGHEGVVRLLVGAGADVRAVDDQERTPLHIAARYGREGVARMLVEAGADVRAVDVKQRTPLHLAAWKGKEGVARVLAEEGADVNAVTAYGNTPLHWAARNGHEGVARVLVEAGADVRGLNRFQYTPLHWVAREGHEGVARLLIEVGADVRAVDMNQCTPLHLAAEGGHEGVVRLLVGAGADVRAVDDQERTPLHIASLRGHEGVVRLLVGAGADVRVVDRYQYTPLHCAAIEGHEGAARVLVEAGADVRAVDVNQRTPLHIAALRGHEVVARMLVEAGAYIICTRTQRVPLRDGGRLVAMAVDLPDGSNWIAGDGTFLEGAMSRRAFDYYLANLGKETVDLAEVIRFVQRGGKIMLIDPGDGTHPGVKCLQDMPGVKRVITDRSSATGSCGWGTLEILAQLFQMGEKDVAAMLLSPSYPGGPSHAVAVKGFPSVLSITDKQPELPSDDDANKVFPEEEHEEPMNDGIGRSFMKAMYAVNYICKAEEAERKLEMAWYLPTPENRLQAAIGLGEFVVYGLAGVTLGGIDVAVVTPVMQIGSALGRGDTSPEATEQLRASAVTLTACTLAGFGVPGAIFVCMSGMVVSTMLYVDSAIRQRASWEQEKRSPGFNLDSVVAREDFKAEMTSLLGKASCLLGLTSTEVSGDSNGVQIGDIGAGIEVVGIASVLGGMLVVSGASGEVPVINDGVHQAIAA